MVPRLFRLHPSQKCDFKCRVFMQRTVATYGYHTKSYRVRLGGHCIWDGTTIPYFRSRSRLR